MKNLIKKSVLSLGVITLLPFSAFADTYNIDPVHSSAVFKIKHLDSTYVHGRFNDIKGQVTFDAKNPEKSSVNIEIDTNSVDTKVQQRDDHLRSPDFFNVKEFPKMVFTSKEVKKVNNSIYNVKGTFTLHGVSKFVTVNFNVIGQNKKGMKGELRGGGETTFKIKRSDYGMNFMPQMLGNDVEITLAIEGIKQ